MIRVTEKRFRSDAVLVDIVRMVSPYGQLRVVEAARSRRLSRT
jgi:hypothetical protein